MTVPKLNSTRKAQSNDMCQRTSNLPLVTKSDIRPSAPNLEVIGVLNPSFFLLNGERFLIVRVDERPKIKDILTSELNKRFVEVPYLNNDGGVKTQEVFVPADFDPDRESILPYEVRVSENSEENRLYLSFMSHLRFARITIDGVSVADSPAVFPADLYSLYGCEDPRATVIEGVCYITFGGIGRFGATGCLVTVSDKAEIMSRHVILGPDHKHCVLFPRCVGSEYAMLTRPLTRSTIASEGIWIMRGTEILRWGQPEPLLHPRKTMWDSERVGPGPSPIEIPEGWLLLYYGVDDEQSYHLGAALLDLEDPTSVIARCSRPVLSPVLCWEKHGRRADTIFSCGAEVVGNGSTIRIYYGAADSCIGAADIEISKLRAEMSF